MSSITNCFELLCESKATDAITLQNPFLFLYPKLKWTNLLQDFFDYNNFNMSRNHCMVELVENFDQNQKHRTL